MKGDFGSAGLMGKAGVLSSTIDTEYWSFPAFDEIEIIKEEENLQELEISE
jgi:hypothetical protein